ncbi:MAG: PaeR7I family type II restriction endonuclease [Nitrospirota bacterium]|nr:PaeR7I family type II restriction endonuclease [Nitrospirota bacterium]
MPLDLAGYDVKAGAAVKSFWSGRKKAAKKQRAAGRKDQGERSAVTAGSNMNGFIDLVVDIVHANGLPKADIMLKRKVLTLPGYFRPTKLWDLLVLNQEKLIAAVEFKSQVGPSFGNNANNRCEEALGTAIDLWTAFREGAFGESRKPFVGYVMLLEDVDASRSPVSDSSPNFPVFPEFKGASYAERYNILCRKLMAENLYTSAAVILSPRSASKSGSYAEMSELTGLKSFVTTLAGHIAAEAVLKK